MNKQERSITIVAAKLGIKSRDKFSTCYYNIAEGGGRVPNILPVSELRNYKSVLGQVSYGNPVYLTKNGKGNFAIVDMKELDELRAIKSLFNELEKGEASARKEGWISLADAEKRLGL